MDVVECMKPPVCNGYSVSVDNGPSRSKETEPSWGFSKGATKSDGSNSVEWAESFSSQLTGISTEASRTNKGNERGRLVSFGDGDEWDEFTGSRQKAAPGCLQGSPSDPGAGLQSNATPRPYSERQLLAGAVFRTCFEVPDPVSTRDERTGVSNESSENRELISLEMNGVQSDRLALSENR